VRLLEAQLGRVLDRHDSLLGPDERGQRVERRRLARAGAAGDEQVAAGGDRAPQRVAQRLRPGAELDEVVRGEAAAPEAADGEDRSVERERRDDHVHARAVGQPRVAQRLGLVDPAAQGREDPLDRVAQSRGVLEAHAGRLDPPAALDVDGHLPAHPVDHDLVDRGVAQQRLQRAEAERALGDELDEAHAGARVQQRRLLLDERADPRVQVALVAGVGRRDEVLAEPVGEAVEWVVHTGSRTRAGRIRPSGVGAAARRRVLGRLAGQAGRMSDQHDAGQDEQEQLEAKEEGLRRGGGETPPPPGGKPREGDHPGDARAQERSASGGSVVRGGSALAGAPQAVAGAVGDALELGEAARVAVAHVDLALVERDALGRVHGLGLQLGDLRLGHGATVPRPERPRSRAPRARGGRAPSRRQGSPAPRRRRRR
jgi:hypothetical protein